LWAITEESMRKRESPEDNKQMKYRFWKVSVFSMAFVLLLGGCASVRPEGAHIDKSTPAERLAAAWGIEIVSTRLTAAGHMIDLRYRVVDPEKAGSFISRSAKIYMIDQTTGERLSVPRTRLGPLRQTSVKPLKDKIYFVFFANKDGVVREGSRVAVIVGDQKIENLVVQ
jgi:hypothetical protein